MAVPFSNSKLRVPQGFQGLLEGLAKEVLMMQPPDIYAFCAMYFESKLSMRDSGDQDQAAKVAEIEDRTYNNSAFKNGDFAASSAEQETAATTIQSQYRTYQAKATTDGMREEKAAVKIQSCARGFVARRKVRAIRAERASAAAADRDEDGDADDELLPLVDDEDLTRPADLEAVGDNELSSHRSGPEMVAASPGVEPVESPGPAPELHLPDEDEEAASELDTDRRSTGRKTPGSDRKSLASDRKSPGTDRKSPGTDRKSPGSDRKSPGTDRRSPGTDRKSPDADRNSPAEEAAETEEQETARDDLEQTELEEEMMGYGGGCAPLDDDGDETARTSEPAETFRGDEDVKEHEGETLEENDEEMERAAAKIQAGFRGMKVRKGLKENQENGEEEMEGNENMEVEPADVPTEENENAAEGADKDQNALDEDDPEVHKAAAKIQAGFRGMKARHDAKQLPLGETGEGATDDEKNERDGEVEDAKEEAADEAEMEKAAAKIEAGLHGMKTREELHEAKGDDHAVKDEENIEGAHSKEDDDEAPGKVVEAHDWTAEEEEAAKKIQAGFRGYKTRKMADDDNDRPSSATKDHDESEHHHGGTPRDENEASDKKPDVDIEMDDPALQDAAVKIQAGFRGHKARKELKKDGADDDEPQTAPSPSPAADEKNHDEKPTDSEAIDLSDPAVNEAVVKIQAGFKGFKTRKQLHAKAAQESEADENHEDNSAENAAESREHKAPSPENDVADNLDHDSEERQNAMEKIQAGLMAYKTRQQLHSGDDGDDHVAGDEDNDDAAAPDTAADNDDNASAADDHDLADVETAHDDD